MELLAIGALGLVGKLLSTRSVRERMKYQAFDGTLPDERKIVQERWEKAKVPEVSGVFANKHMVDNYPFFGTRTLGNDEKEADVRTTKLELFTGVDYGENGSWLRPKKKEVESFYRPEDNMVMVTSLGTGGNPFSNLDTDRYIPGDKVQGVSAVMNPLRDRNALKEDPLFRAEPIMPHAKHSEMVLQPLPGVAAVPSPYTTDDFCSSLTRMREDSNGTEAFQGINPVAVQYQAPPAETLVSTEVRNKLPHAEYVGPARATNPMNDSARSSQITRTDDRTLGNPLLTVPSGAKEGIVRGCYTRDHREALGSLPQGIPRAIPSQDVAVGQATNETKRGTQTTPLLNLRGPETGQATNARSTSERKNGEMALPVPTATNAFAFQAPPNLPTDESRAKKEAENLSLPVMEAAGRVLVPGERVPSTVSLAKDAPPNAYVASGQAPIPKPPAPPVDVKCADRPLVVAHLQPEKGVYERLEDATIVETNKKNRIEEPAVTYANMTLPDKNLGDFTREPRKVCPENPHPPISHLPF
jgi:hypothetical protein